MKENSAGGKKIKKNNTGDKKTSILVIIDILIIINILIMVNILICLLTSFCFVAISNNKPMDCNVIKNPKNNKHLSILVSPYNCF